MQLRDGRECFYFYVNSHRRTSQHARCNLITGTPDESAWSPRLCATCRVPEITIANACPTMQLSIEIMQPGLRFWRKPRIIVSAFCKRSDKPVRDPMIGCGLCHTQYEFIVASESTAPQKNTEKET